MGGSALMGAVVLGGCLAGGPAGAAAKPAVLASSASDGSTTGYWEVSADGEVYAFNAPFYGSMAGRPLNAPIVGMDPTPDRHGYWEVAADGGMFAFGDARFYGSMAGRPLNAPIVGMEAMPDGGGYVEVAADGGVFAFGDAPFYGSYYTIPTQELPLLNPLREIPVVGIPLADLLQPDLEVLVNLGYGNPVVGWGTGTVAFIEAGRLPDGPFVGLLQLPGAGNGWVLGANGGVFALGDAQFYGSMGGSRLNQPAVGMAATADDGGYWIAGADGGVFAFGDAPFYGSMAGQPLDQPIVGIKAA
ncbi:MAG TPA: PE-PPE domain-containing protein [Acidimicrobiales bacterium]|nr:PE-PPE domain-containing protein [Acidimicrobiales bacterium]